MGKQAKEMREARAKRMGHIDDKLKVKRTGAPWGGTGGRGGVRKRKLGR